MKWNVWWGRGTCGKCRGGPSNGEYIKSELSKDGERDRLQEKAASFVALKCETPKLEVNIISYGASVEEIWSKAE